jgi:hypothetical protein
MMSKWITLSGAPIAPSGYGHVWTGLEMQEWYQQEYGEPIPLETIRSRLKGSHTWAVVMAAPKHIFLKRQAEAWARDAAYAKERGKR